MMKITNTKNKTNAAKLPRVGKLLLITGLSLMLTVSVFAQATTDTPAGPGQDPDETTVPFDGGITLLAAAGVAYGIKRWRDSRKENDAKEPDREL